MIALYGIPNCDTVKKARAWLKDREIAHTFHDFKKEGVDPAQLSAWADATGWETLLNRRGTTFRGLTEADKADIDRDKALELMVASPSLIKRPVAEHEGGVLVSFSDKVWSAALL